MGDIRDSERFRSITNSNPKRTTHKTKQQQVTTIRIPVDIDAALRINSRLFELSEREAAPLKAIPQLTTKVDSLERIARSLPDEQMYGLSKQQREALDANRRELTATRRELETAKVSHGEISSAINETSKQVSQLRAQREARFRQVVAEAVEAASEHRERFRTEQAKLDDLRGKRTELEDELRKLREATAAEKSENDRVAELLATGKFPPANTAPTAAMQELQGKLQTVALAIPQQEHQTALAKTNFAAEVRRHLNAAFSEIAVRSADAIRRAQIAANDAHLLGQAFSAATGTIAPTGIACPAPDSQSFRNWLTGVSRLGYITSEEKAH